MEQTKFENGRKTSSKGKEASMNIEDLAKRFVALASKSILSKAEHEEARNLMRQLKEEGVSNEEISELSGGKWTSSTVKGYTKGVKAGTSNEWQSAVNLFDELMAANMTLEDVERALAVRQALDESHISLGQVADLLLAADSSSVDNATLVRFYEDLKQQGLSVQDVAEVLGFKKELEEKGLGLDSLNPIVELAKSHGHPDEVIAAVAKYQSLAEIEDRIAVTTNELDSLNQQLARANHELKQVENKASRLKRALEAYEEVSELGFTEPQLTKLADLARKHGTVKSVLKVVEAYSDYMDIMHMAKEANADLVAKKAEIGKLEADYAHLKTVTTMCQTLIDKYKFGLDAVTMVFSAAGKYGEPVDVLKAIEGYGKLQVIYQKLNELEGGIVERKRSLAQLEGKEKEMLNELESLNVMALRVGTEINKVQSEVARSKELDKVINLIEEPASASYHEYIPLVATITASLRKWVINNESKFRSTYSIKDGLNSLLSQIGGD